MKRILIIDDEQSLLMVTVRTLQFLGFEAAGAADGAGVEMGDGEGIRWPAHGRFPHHESGGARERTMD